MTQREVRQKLSADVTEKFTAPTTMHTEERQECPLRHSKCEQEDWAAVSDSEHIVPYKLDQSRVEAYTTGFSQTSIFIPSPLSGRTNGAEMASRREQVSALFFAA